MPGLADRVRTMISAPTTILECDSRDDVLTPTRGVYAESAGLAARNALGATVDLERLGQVMQGWRPLRDDVTLGARGSYA